MYMKLTCYHTLYKSNVTYMVCGKIEFKDGYANFASGGHRYSVEVKHIVSIESIED